MWDMWSVMCGATTGETHGPRVGVSGAPLCCSHMKARRRLGKGRQRRESMSSANTMAKFISREDRGADDGHSAHRRRMTIPIAASASASAASTSGVAAGIAFAGVEDAVALLFAGFGSGVVAVTFAVFAIGAGELTAG